MNWPRERMIVAGVGALVVLVLLFGGISMAQRNAYMEGYMLGRLSAPAEVAAGAAAPGVAPVVPYAPVMVGYPQHGPGPFGILFLVLGIGAVFFVMRRMAHLRAWRHWAMMQGMPGGPGGWQGGPGGPEGWRQGPPWMQGGPEAWKQGPPWMQERMKRCWEQAQEQGQAQAEQKPAQATDAPSAASAPTTPENPTAGER